MDVWDDDTNDFDLEAREREWQQMKRKYSGMGYREGRSAASDEHVQLSFNEGFLAGGALGERFGRLHGLIAVLRSQYARTVSAALEDLEADMLEAVRLLRDGGEDAALGLDPVVNAMVCRAEALLAEAESVPARPPAAALALQAD